MGGRLSERERPAVGPHSALDHLLVDRDLMAGGGNQYRQQAEALTGLHVERAVPDHRARREVERERARGAFEQLRSGLAAAAPGLRRVGTIVERVDPAPFAGEYLVHPSVDPFHILYRVESPLDARRIRNADDEIPVPAQQARGLRDPAVDLEPPGVRDVPKVGID